MSIRGLLIGRARGPCNTSRNAYARQGKPPIQIRSLTVMSNLSRSTQNHSAPSLPVLKTCTFGVGAMTNLARAPLRCVYKLDGFDPLA